jgi:protocatechuate 3,4-dioxygenase beta subunit
MEPGMSGVRLIVAGYVYTTDCQPVPGAQIEFWQAGPDGQYDLQGYRFRGHLFTDENGFYRLETLLPAVYEGRPRHIHVKVLPQNAPGLTTQLYFPDDSPLPALTVDYNETAGEAQAMFNFVVAAP